MDPIIGGLITGAASLFGNMFSSSTSANAQAQNTQAQIAAQQAMLNQTEDFNKGMAYQTEDWTMQNMAQAQQYSQANVAAQEQYETQMSNTAYQRATADMKAAGINPILAAGGGVASTPSVAAPSGPMGSAPSASVGTPSVPLSQRGSPLAGLSSLGDAVGKVISSAQGMQALTQQQADIDLRRSQKHAVDADTHATEVDTMLKGSRGQGIPDELQTIHNQAVQSGAKAIEADNAREEAQGVKNLGPAALQAAGAGKYLADSAGKVVTGVFDAAAPLISSAKSALSSGLSGQAKAYRYGGPEFRQWMKDNQYLGGRQPGNAGSFDNDN